MIFVYFIFSIFSSLTRISLDHETHPMWIWQTTTLKYCNGYFITEPCALEREKKKNVIDHHWEEWRITCTTPCDPHSESNPTFVNLQTTSLHIIMARKRNPPGTLSLSWWYQRNNQKQNIGLTTIPIFLCELWEKTIFSPLFLIFFFFSPDNEHVRSGRLFLNTQYNADVQVHRRHVICNVTWYNHAQWSVFPIRGKIYSCTFVSRQLFSLLCK